MCRKNKIVSYSYHSDILLKKKNNQYYFIQLQTFASQIQIQICESDSDSEPLNKQTTP